MPEGTPRGVRRRSPRKQIVVCQMDLLEEDISTEIAKGILETITEGTAGYISEEMHKRTSGGTSEELS